MIVVKINDIPENGLKIVDTISPREMESTPDEYIYFTEPLKVKLRVQKFDEIVLVRAHIEGVFSSVCSLSSKPITGSIVRDADLSFDIERNTESISITEDLRQEVLLALPLKITYLDDMDLLESEFGITLDIPEDLDLKEIPKFEEAIDDYESEEEPKHQPFLKLKDIE